jgi:hypothetical protein
VAITTAVGTATSATQSQATLGMSFTVICPTNTNGYCNPGIWAYNGAAQVSGNAVPPALPIGRSYPAVCVRDGGSAGRVDASPWGGTTSTLWVQFYYANANNPQNAFIPVAWLSFSNGGGPGNLDGC